MSIDSRSPYTRASVSIERHVPQLPDYPIPAPRVCKSWKDVQAIIPKLANGFAVDVERPRYEDVPVRKVAVLSLASNSGTFVLPSANRNLMAPLATILKDSNVPKYFFSAGRDICCLRNTGFNVRGEYDVQKLVPYVYPSEKISIGLDASVGALLGVNMDKRLQCSNFVGVLTTEQMEYAAADAFWTLLLYQEVAARLARTGRWCWVDEDRMFDLAQRKLPDRKPGNGNNVWTSEMKADARARQKKARSLASLLAPSVRDVAREYSVCPELLATKTLLTGLVNAVIEGHKSCRLLRGWRGEICGTLLREEAEAVLRYWLHP